MANPSEDKEAMRSQVRERIAEVIEGSVPEELLDFVADDDVSRDLVYDAERVVEWVQGAALDHVFQPHETEQKVVRRIEALKAEAAATEAGASRTAPVDPELAPPLAAGEGKSGVGRTDGAGEPPVPSSVEASASLGERLGPRGRFLAVLGVALAIVAAAGLALRSRDSVGMQGPPWEGVVSGLSSGEGLELCPAVSASCHPIGVDSRIQPGALVRTDARTRARIELEDGTRVTLDTATELVLDADRPRSARLESGRIVAEVARRGDGALATFDVPLGHAQVLGTKFALSAEHGFVSLDVSRGAVKLVDRQDREVTVYAGEQGRLYPGQPPTATSAPSLGHSFGWSEFAFDPDEGDAEFAPGLGQLVAKEPGEESERAGAVSLSRHSVKVRISGPIARTEIEEVFSNETDEVLEGIYRFPLPPDAQIERLALDVDGKMIDGAFVARDKAAAIWRGAIVNSSKQKLPVQEEIVWVPGPWKDPALLEWQRGGQFELRIFPIPKRGTRRVVLAYTQVIQPVGATRRYTYPLAVDPSGSTRVRRFELDAQIRGLDPDFGVRARGYELDTRLEQELGTAVFSARDFSPAGDIVLEYALPHAEREMTAWAYRSNSGDKLPLPVSDQAGADDQRPEVAGGSYAALALRPKLPRATERGQQNIALVVDSSRSMLGERYRRATRLAERLAAELDPMDRVTVLACDAQCREISGGPREPGADAARAVASFLASVTPEGGSDVAAAVRFGVDAARADQVRAARVIYIGDGTPTVGPTQSAFLQRDIADAVSSAVRVTAVALGADADTQALEAVARAGGGAVLRYTPGHRTSEMAYAVLGVTYGAALRNVKVELPDGLVDSAPSKVPSIHAGEEAYIVAKMTRPVVSGAVKISGEVAGRPFEQSYPLKLESTAAKGNAFVPRLYAAAKIAELEHDPRSETRDRVVELSKRFSVASRHTSLLVLESQAMFRAFGLDNERKAVEWSGEDDLESEQSDGAISFGPADLEAPASAGGGAPRRSRADDLARLGSGASPRSRAPRPSVAKKAKPRSERMAAPPSAGWPGAQPQPTSSPEPRDPFVLEEAPALEMPPPRPRPMIPMRKVWERTGRFEAGPSVPSQASSDSMAKAEREVEANPLGREPLRALYVLYMLADRIDDAARLAERWSEKEPLDPEALTARADVAAAQGNRALAIRILGSVVDVRPGDHKAQWRLARLHRWAGRPKMGCRHSLAVSQIRPNDSRLLVEAVRCARSVGQSRLASDLLAAADSATRDATERLLRGDVPDADNVRGDLQVSGHWDGGVDLDLALWHPEGHRVSWLGAPTRSVITARDVLSPVRETLGLRGAMPGEYVVEISRGVAGSERITGTIDVLVAGVKQSVPFVLDGERTRVGIAKVSMRSRLVPL